MDGFPMVKVDGKWLISASATAAREKHEAIVLASVYVEFAIRHSVAAKGVIQGRYRSVEKISKFLEDGKPFEEAAATE